MKNAISNILAILWFFGVMLGTLVMLFFFNIMIFFMDIVGPIRSGFASSTIGFAMVFVAGLVFAITGLVPVFRRCYYKLPWLYPLSMILTMDLVILSISESIIHYGYLVMNTQRHIISVIIMIIQMVVCRLAMCAYLKKKPMVLKKYLTIEE